MRLMLPACFQSRTFLVGVVLTFLLIPFAKIIAQRSEFLPADFAWVNHLGEVELAPDDIPADADNILVRCQGFVEIDSSMTNHECVPDHKNRMFVNAVTSVLPEQSFLPAIVADEPVRVLMNFAVLFVCSEASCLAVPIRNHGHHLDEYGLSYVAPQPILSDDNWYDGFETKLDWALESSGFRSERWQLGYIVSVMVNPDGTADEGIVESVGPSRNLVVVVGQDLRESRRVPERAAESIANVSFIPGFYENEPVPMRLIEYGVVWSR